MPKPPGPRVLPTRFQVVGPVASTPPPPPPHLPLASQRLVTLTSPCGCVSLLCPLPARVTCCPRRSPLSTQQLQEGGLGSHTLPMASGHRSGREIRHRRLLKTNLEK